VCVEGVKRIGDAYLTVTQFDKYSQIPRITIYRFWYAWLFALQRKQNAVDVYGCVSAFSARQEVAATWPTYDLRRSR